MTEWNPEPDPADQRTAEELDEDALGVDPVEEGVDVADDWVAANRYGTTPNEAVLGEGLERKLGAERPDVLPEVAGRPVADTPVDELDDTIDDADEPAGYAAPDVLQSEMEPDRPHDG